jgi:homeodomain-containing protein
MPAKKYHVDLTAEERDTLVGLIHSGKTAARQVTRARILLKADEGLSDEEIAEEVATSRVTVERTRQRFVEESLGALTERPRTGAPPRLTGQGAAHLIAVTCSPAPAGRERGTLRLLADEAVALGLADSLCRETVRQLLKKTHSSPGTISKGVSPRWVPSLSRKGRRSSTSTPSPTTPNVRKSTSTRRVNN